MSAADIENRAAQFLISRENGAWSDTDQHALDAWLEESLAHKAAYWRLEHGWRQADRIAALGSSAASHTEGRRPAIGLWWKPLAIAASLAAIIGTATLSLRPWDLKPVRIAQSAYDTAIGGHRLVGLADGSRVELNTQTHVRTAIAEKDREVWLDKGEAYFEVAHAEGRPFVVHAGSRTVTVLGTRFSVRRDGDTVTVSVLEGRVRIDGTSAQTVPAAIITAGDMAIARGLSTLLAARSPDRVTNALAWRDGMLAFDQTTLAQAAAEFNRYNRKQLLITDPQAAGIRIGGTFKATNVDAFARLLHDAYGLNVEAETDAVRISS